MRRSICYCEPKYALAGQVTHFRFIFISAISLPAGTKMLFDLKSDGRDIEWEIPGTDLKKGHNVVYLRVGDGKPIAGTCVGNDKNPAEYEFTLPSEVGEGEPMTFHIGSPSHEEGGEGVGCRAQTYTQRRRPFYLYIDVKGKREYKEAEVFHLDVKGAKLYNIKIISPSMVSKNQRFDVIVRFEDCYGNLTGNAPHGSLIELSYEQLRENLSWKLFIPETGFITLPNLYFNEPGIYKFKLKDSVTGNTYFSAPIKCFQETPSQIYWGLLHGDSTRYDTTENIESALRYFRDDLSLQFYGASCFESEEETKNDDWKNISTHISDFNEDDRFTTFLGFQWLGSIPSEGLRTLVYAKDGKPILRKKDSKSNSIKKIYKSHTPKDLLSIPSFTMAKGFHYNFESYAPEYERVIEIYNAWGSSECLVSEGNLKPITSGKGIQEIKDGSIRSALNQNFRFGFIAGGLDDRGVFEELYSSDQVQYSPGLTAIIAPSHNKDALLTALYNRSCYATTGERMVVTFFIAGSGMGSELSTFHKPGLMYNRYLSGHIATTTEIDEVQIIRNGKVLQSIKPSSVYQYELAYDDLEPFDKIALKPGNEGASPFIYYYIRVTQKDGHGAWSSPIWVDKHDKAPEPKVKK